MTSQEAHLFKERNQVIWLTLFLGRAQEAVKLLLAHGASASAAAVDDMNPLHFAAQKGHAEAVRYLLNAGRQLVQPWTSLGAGEGEHLVWNAFSSQQPCIYSNTVHLPRLCCCHRSGANHLSWIDACNHLGVCNICLQAYMSNAETARA